MVELCKQNLRYKNNCFNKMTVDKYDRLKIIIIIKKKKKYENKKK
jgi:hypothetical protein